MDHFFTCPAKLPLRVIYIYIYIFIYILILKMLRYFLDDNPGSQLTSFFSNFVSTFNLLVTSLLYQYCNYVQYHSITVCSLHV